MAALDPSQIVWDDEKAPAKIDPAEVVWDDETPAMRAGRFVNTLGDVQRTLGNLGGLGPMAGGLAGLGVAGARGIAQPAADIMSLFGSDRGQQAVRAMPEPADVVEPISRALTYQPTTQAGKLVSDATQYPFQLLDQAGQAAGDYVYERGLPPIPGVAPAGLPPGDPAMAALAKTAVQGGAPLLLGIKGREAFEPTPAMRAGRPTPEDVAAFMDRSERPLPPPPPPDVPPGGIHEGEFTEVRRPVGTGDWVDTRLIAGQNGFPSLEEQQRTFGPQEPDVVVNKRGKAVVNPKGQPPGPTIPGGLDAYEGQQPAPTFAGGGPIRGLPAPEPVEAPPPPPAPPVPPAARPARRGLQETAEAAKQSQIADLFRQRNEALAAADTAERDRQLEQAAQDQQEQRLQADLARARGMPEAAPPTTMMDAFLRAASAPPRPAPLPDVPTPQLPETRPEPLPEPPQAQQSPQGAPRETTVTPEGQNRHVVTVSDKAGNPVAEAHITHRPDEGIVEIETAAVTNAQQGKGVGTRLMDAAVAAAQAQYPGVPVQMATTEPKLAQYAKKRGWVQPYPEEAPGIFRSPQEEPATVEEERPAYELAGKGAQHLLPEERAKLRTDTAQKFATIRDALPTAKEMANVALAGKAKRGWYANSANAIIQTFGHDAPRFTALLAATSPQTSVENNLLNALNVWKNWDAAGRPTDPKQILAVMGRSVQGSKGEKSVLGAWLNNSVRALTDADPAKTVLSGPKVNSFMHNLRGKVDEVTNDAWMANYALIDQSLFGGSLTKGGDPGKGPGYLAMSSVAREAAAKLTQMTGEEWTPAEVQETVWSWAKTAYELSESTGRPVVDLVKSGALTDELIGSTPAFGELFNEPRYGSILDEAGLPRPSRPGEGAGARAPAQAGPGAAGQAGPPAPAAREVSRAARRLDALKAQRREAAVGEEAPRYGDGEARVADAGEGQFLNPDLARESQSALESLAKKYGATVTIDLVNHEFEVAHGSQLVGKNIGGPKERAKNLAFLAQVYRHPKIEVMRFIFTDRAGNVVGETGLTSRKASYTGGFPVESHEAVSNWLDSIAPEGATGYWLMHNHPNGNPTPSSADRRFTLAMKHRAQLPLLGHVILDHDTFGLIRPDDTVNILPVKSGEPTRTGSASDLGFEQINSPDAGQRAALKIQSMTPENSFALMATDSKGNLITAGSIPAERALQLMQGKRGAALLSMTGKRAGPTAGMYIVAPHEALRDNPALLQSLMDALDNGLLTDVIATKGGDTFSLANDRARFGIEPEFFGHHFMERKGEKLPEVLYSKGGKSGEIEAKPTPAGVAGSAQTGNAKQLPQPVPAYDGYLSVRETDEPPDYRPGSERNPLPPKRPGESDSDYARRVRVATKEEMKRALETGKKERAKFRLGFRAYLAQMDRANATADASFSAHRVLFDKTPSAVNLSSIHQWETGRPVTDLDARRFFRMMDEANNQRVAAIRRERPDALQSVVTNYFAHFYKDPVAAKKYFSQHFEGRRPLQGKAQFLKEREWPTLQQAMRYGHLEPISTNPVDFALVHLQQMDKFLEFSRMLSDMKARGWVREMKPGEPVPVGYGKVNDPAFKKAGGLQGYFAIPDDMARDINNYLSPGLAGNKLWQSWRAVQNLVMSARLGWGLFHAGFTTADSIVTGADVGLQRILRGDIPGGLMAVLEGFASPAIGHTLVSQFAQKPVRNIGRMLKGDVSKQVAPMDEHTRALLDMITQGGARLKMSSTDYNNALPQIRRKINQWRADGLFNVTAMGTLKGVGTAIKALGELGSWWMHHWLVPRQKMAARALLAKFELDRLASALGKEKGDYAGIIDAMNPDVMRQISAKISDTIDFRLGQMAYDNQFFNRTAVQLAQLAVGAPGWQYGMFQTVLAPGKEIGKALAGKGDRYVGPVDKAGTLNNLKPRQFQNLSYLVMLATLLGGLGAWTQKILTGKDPEEAKDVFFPRTGRRNADDTEERLQYPTYWQDHYKVVTEPVQTLQHKIHPTWGMLWDFLANKDYFGTEVHHKGDPWGEQVKQVAHYLTQGITPYTVTQAQKAQTPAAATASVFGITKAPASVSETPFQEFVADKMRANTPQAARTQIQADKSRAIAQAKSDIRNGVETDLSEFTDKEVKRIQKEAQVLEPEVRFHRLSADDKVIAYGLASPEERERYHLDRILRNMDRSKLNRRAAQNLQSEERGR